MKSFFTLLIILLINTNVNSQNVKPTLEQTVAFINQTLKSAEGKKGDYYVVGKVNFTSEEYSVDNIYMKYTSSEHYLNLKWASYRLMHGSANESADSDPSFMSYTVFFDENIKVETNFMGKSTSKYWDQFHLIFAKVKEDSMRKAFDRLKELAMETNKDPFQN